MLTKEELPECPVATPSGRRGLGEAGRYREKAQRARWTGAPSRNGSCTGQTGNDLGGNMERTEPIRRLSLRFVQAEGGRWMLDGREPHQGYSYS